MFLMGELVAALRANDPDAFRQWLSGGVQDLGEPVVEELLMDWLYSFLTVEEQDRLTGCLFSRAAVTVRIEHFFKISSDKNI